MEELLSDITDNMNELENLGKKLPNVPQSIKLPDEWINGVKIDYTRQPIPTMVKPTGCKFVNAVVIETEEDMPEDTVNVLKAILKILKDTGTQVRMSPIDPSRKIVEGSGITVCIYTPFAKFGSDIPPEDKDTPPPKVYFDRPSAPYFRVANWVYGNNRDGIPILQGFKPHGRNMAATAAAMYYGTDLKSLPAMSITFSGSGATMYDPQGFKLKEYNTGRLIKFSSKLDIPVFNIAMSDSVAKLKLHIMLIVKKFHHDGAGEELDVLTVPTEAPAVKEAVGKPVDDTPIEVVPGTPTVPPVDNTPVGTGGLPF